MVQRETTDPFMLRLQSAIANRRRLVQKARTRQDVGTVQADDDFEPEQIDIVEALDVNLTGPKS